jgi:hypothetical protein
MRARVGRAAPDPSNYEETQRWLAKQPREVSVAISARAALRALPLIVDVRNEPNFLSAIALRAFRAAAAAWFVAVHPSKRKEVPSSVTDHRSGVPAFVGNAAGAAFNAAIAAVADDRMDVSFVAAAAFSEAFSAVSDTAAGAARTAALTDMNLVSGGDSDTKREALTVGLAGGKLWPDQMPDVALKAWGNLRAMLLSAGDDWQVWYPGMTIAWPADRL